MSTSLSFFCSTEKIVQRHLVCFLAHITDIKTLLLLLLLLLLLFSSSSSSSSSSHIYPPQSRTCTPRTYKPNARGSDACRGSNSLWTRTLDIYTRAGLPECVVSTMSEPPPKTTQDRTQTKDKHPIPGQKLKFLTPTGIEPGPPGWKAGTPPTMPRRRSIIYYYLSTKF